MKIARFLLPLFLVSTIPLRAAQPTDEETRITLLAEVVHALTADAPRALSDITASSPSTCRLLPQPRSHVRPLYVVNDAFLI